jgi:hypothetical protein
MWSFKPSSFILNYGEEYPEDQFSDITTNPYNSVAYKVVACVIFGVVSYTFLFPCNALIPLDRRTVAVLGAILCYCTRTFVFIDRQMNMLQAVDFDVLVLLASIMAINHLVVHLKGMCNKSY